MRLTAMDPNLPETGTDRECQEDWHLPAQTELGLIDVQENLDQISETYEVHRKAVGIYGGRKKLAIATGNPIDYEADVSNGLNRRHGRHAFIDWRVPLLKHPEAGSLLIAWDCAMGGFEIPKRRPVASAGEKLDAILRVLGESGGIGDDVVKRAAAQLGVDVGSFKR